MQRSLFQEECGSLNQTRITVTILIPRASLPYSQFLRDRCSSLRCFSEGPALHKLGMQDHLTLITRSSGSYSKYFLQPL